jgi:cytochrome c oxidase assembly protein subunit 15
MVYAIILVGGATRLTDSGLSITEWRPVSGALPPMNEAAWLAEFDKYRSTTQYQLTNAGMSMSEFQFIYWWEWGHRQIGRLIGLVETDRVAVAPYRLMTHFSLALIILAVIAWLWLDLGPQKREGAPKAARQVALALMLLIFVQMAAGALVAGLDAGRTYTDWPLMAGELFPTHYMHAELGVRSLFEGREATQFNHRLLAYILWAGSLAAAWAFRKTAVRREFAFLAVLVSAQAIWGILTLLNAAPMGLALVHQGLGVVTTLWAVYTVWRAGGPETRLSPSA